MLHQTRTDPGNEKSPKNPTHAPKGKTHPHKNDPNTMTLGKNNLKYYAMPKKERKRTKGKSLTRNAPNSRNIHPYTLAYSATAKKQTSLFRTGTVRIYFVTAPNPPACNVPQYLFGVP